jgi:glutathione S-transferase
MYKLYYSPGAASMVVHWLLIETGALHTIQRVDTATGEHKRPDYLAINPNGLVPTLLIDGVPVFEAAALLLHVADAHPDAGFAPPLGSVKRAHYYQWMLHLANTLQPAFRLWFYPAEAAGEAAVGQAKESARMRIEACWDRIDTHLGAHGPYLLGDHVSAADFHLTMLMRWSRNMPRPASDWPHLAAMIVRMKARPSFRTLYEREGLTEWA